MHMSYLLITFILFVICAIAYGVGRSWSTSEDPSMKSMGNITKWSALIVFALLAVIWTGAKTFHAVPAGHVGVVYQFGNIVGQTGSGLVVTAPWQDLNQANVQVQRESFDQLDSFSKETQDVFIKATINYEVSPSDIQTLYRTVGPNYFDKLVPTRVNQLFKDETVKFAAVNIAPNRETIRKEVLARLKAELAKYSIQVDDLLIDNINFSKEFTRAIEDKQIATQEAKAAENRVKTAQAQASQVIAAAKGQAKAQKLQRSSLTPLLVQKYMIDKLNPNVQVILMPSNGNLLLPSNLFPTK
jgi:regulator of protease activity HflC (stomatin/prohibitin superfamily)